MTGSAYKRVVSLASWLALNYSSAFQTASPIHVLQTNSPALFPFCAAASSNIKEDPDDSSIPSYIQSPVLAKVYPALLSHKSKFGNPNIPLGSENGKRCKTLRRLHFQNKLSPDEVNLLTDLGFRFNSFEDVYTECDFNEMLEKLKQYHAEYKTYQIPKKYQIDPELGAWVTMLRRLYRTNDLPEDEVKKMDDIDFEWISTRKCGSAFMSGYREVLEKLNGAADVEKLVKEDVEMRKWFHAQKCAYENGKLSESRAQYLNDLPGIDWKDVSV
jgi:hypothetical protein